MKPTRALFYSAAMAFLGYALVLLFFSSVAHAQAPVLPYSVKSSTQKPVGDGSAGSVPLPVTMSGFTPGGGVYVYTPLGCYQITSMVTAQNLPTVPAGATLISLSVENAAVRLRDDGTAPTASIGLLLPIGGPWPYSGSLTAVQFIQVTGGAIIDYCSYK